MTETLKIDFTKEELKLIAECVEADFYHTNWSQSMYDPLMYKIKTMIENHREDFIGDRIKCYLCNRCKEELINAIL
jgi:hypothetical protein